LKDKKSNLNQDQWESILSTVLLGIAPEQGHDGITEGLEAVASVDAAGPSMTITIRKRIEGITVWHMCLLFLIYSSTG
jgi:hypothetical protein